MASVCNWAVTLADISLVVLLKQLIDDSLAQTPGTVARHGAPALAILLAREMASYLAGRLSLTASAGLVSRLRESLFVRYQELSLDFHSRHNSGALLSRLFHDVDNAAQFVSRTVADVAQAPLRAVALLVALWFLDPVLAVMTPLLLVPAGLASRLFGNHLRTRFQASYELLGQLHERAQEALAAIHLTRALGREDGEEAEFRDRSQRHVASQRSLYDVLALDSPMRQGLKLLGLLAALLYGSQAVAAGRLSAGELTAALAVAYAFLGAGYRLTGLYASAQEGLVAAERVFAHLDEPAALSTPAGAPVAVFARELRFDDVSYTYPGREPAIRGVSVRVRRGEHVALLGVNGSGKTTLLRLAARMCDPSRGRVSLDGCDLRELDLATLRHLYSVVLQDGPVLDRSLHDNIAYGRPDAPARDVEAAVELVELGSFVAGLRDGLNTRVGQNGVALSGGQRQRVALARAALRSAPILLLDEASSALDVESEARILGRLYDRMGGGSVITVSHRPATLGRVDRILVLEEGRLADDDDPEAVCRRRGSLERLGEIYGQRLV